MPKVPSQPKIYHIVHVDRLPSIVADGHLWCDALVTAQDSPGTAIGMSQIKKRRLGLPFGSHSGLHVGDCVPFYLCPRSVMLYILHCANHEELVYRGGQEPILHLEADLAAAVDWADQNGKRWAFTLSNAGAYYFEDRCDLSRLNEIDWDSVRARKWSGLGVPLKIKEGKQAEFLLEERFPWELVERIGVLRSATMDKATQGMTDGQHRPQIEIRPDWYY